VKKIPMQNATNPRKENITPTISNPKRTKNCLETSIKLPLIASKAFKFPNIIKGTVKKVKKETT
jgi:hypothetical protein